TKTDAGRRTIPLNDAAAWALGRLRQRAEKIGASLPTHFLLPHANYRRTKAEPGSRGTGFDLARPMRCWRTAWRSLTAEAGLAGLRFHDLRHHAITKMVEQGAPDGTIMSLAGHVSRAMLEHYSHVRIEAKRTAVAGISAGMPAQVETPTASDAIQ
ncbi:MAG: tyrosine-type recombinase/integrase, partial [Terriglobales bacterium]